MEYNKQLAYMEKGDEVEGFYILKTAVLRTSTTGKPYLSASLADASGKIDAKMWDYNGKVTPAEEGKIVKIRGEVTEFKGSLQLNIRKIRLAEDRDNYALEDLVPTAPITRCPISMPSVDLSVTRPKSEKSYSRSLPKSCRSVPARSRLLFLLLAGTLLHDFGKEREYDFSDFGLVTDKSTEGMLIGHLVIGAEEVGEVGRLLDIPEEKLLLLRHMLLSHHGTPEFGAAVIPSIAEAELLSYIDLLDSRMEIYAETFETLPAGKFSEKIFSLEKRIYNHGLKDGE